MPSGPLSDGCAHAELPRALGRRIVRLHSNHRFNRLGGEENPRGPTRVSGIGPANSSASFEPAVQSGWGREEPSRPDPGIGPPSGSASKRPTAAIDAPSLTGYRVLVTKGHATMAPNVASTAAATRRRTRASTTAAATGLRHLELILGDAGIDEDRFARVAARAIEELRGSEARI